MVNPSSLPIERLVFWDFAFVWMALLICTLFFPYRLTTWNSCPCTDYPKITENCFFGKVRSLGGCNNNPSARQFISSYRKLIVHADLQDVLRGNCLPLESVPILTAVSTSSKVVMEINSSVPQSRLIDVTSLVDNNECELPESISLSICAENIVTYIAGFVTFRLKNSLLCEPCISAIVNGDPCNSAMHKLIQLKSRGNLTFPSNDTVNVCLEVEKLFRRDVMIDSKCSLSNVTCHKLVQSVLEKGAQKYVQVRCNYAGRQYTTKCHSKQRISRQRNNKMVIFTGV